MPGSSPRAAADRGVTLSSQEWKPSDDANQSPCDQGEKRKCRAFSYERAVGSHDVLVRITHCSIARGDVQFMDNEWGDARFPLVPGHEIVGIAEEFGSEVAGRRAAIVWVLVTSRRPSSAELGVDEVPVPSHVGGAMDQDVGRS